MLKTEYFLKMVKPPEKYKLKGAELISTSVGRANAERAERRLFDILEELRETSDISVIAENMSLTEKSVRRKLLDAFNSGIIDREQVGKNGKHPVWRYFNKE